MPFLPPNRFSKNLPFLLNAPTVFTNCIDDLPLRLILLISLSSLISSCAYFRIGRVLQSRAGFSAVRMSFLTPVQQNGKMDFRKSAHRLMN